MISCKKCLNFLLLWSFQDVVGGTTCGQNIQKKVLYRYLTKLRQSPNPYRYRYRNIVVSHDCSCRGSYILFASRLSSIEMTKKPIHFRGEVIKWIQPRPTHAASPRTAIPSTHYPPPHSISDTSRTASTTTISRHGARWRICSTRSCCSSKRARIETYGARGHAEVHSAHADAARAYPYRATGTLSQYR